MKRKIGDIYVIKEKGKIVRVADIFMVSAGLMVQTFVIIDCHGNESTCFATSLRSATMREQRDFWKNAYESM